MIYLTGYHITFSQCLSIENKAPISNEVKNNYDIKKYENLKEGEFQDFFFSSNKNDNRSWRESNVRIKKINGELVLFIIGECKTFIDGKVWCIEHYDSCGVSIRDDFYDNLDSNRTGIGILKIIKIDGKKFKFYRLINKIGEKETIKEEIIMPHGRRKRHGKYKVIMNGITIEDKDYYFGKLIKDNLIK